VKRELFSIRSDDSFHRAHFFTASQGGVFKIP
jgi:hypothetical protein